MAVVTSSRSRVAVTSFSLFCVSLLLTAYSSKNPGLAMMGYSAISEVTEPVQGAMHYVRRGVLSVIDSYVSLVGVEAENQDLRTRMAQLEEELSKSSEFRMENDRLRGILDFRERQGLQGVVASVVGMDPSGWVRGITIDRGASSGIKRDMAVVHARGIVGIVVAVSPDTARVQLIIDHASSVDAFVQSNRARGVVEGSGSRRCDFRYVTKEYRLKNGDLVVTSGMDAIFPKGLIIGTISEVDPDESGMFRAIEVTPSVDFSRLEEVYVITTPPVLEVEQKAPLPVEKKGVK